ncbi:MAG TPA: hypothetical protein V6D47_22285 [Oscillatoriaceae cyanobacterium]
MGRSAMRSWIALACSLGLMGCTGSPLNALHGESTVSGNAFGNVTINVNGRNFELVTMDHKPLGDVSIQAGGQIFKTQAGAFNLPASVMTHAKNVTRGLFVVLAQGYTPTEVAIDQSDPKIVLTPIRPALIATNFTPSGGTLTTPDQKLSVKVPAGLIKNANTNVAVSTYTPPITAQDQSTLQSERSSFLAAVRKNLAGGGGVAAGGGNYRVAQADDLDQYVPDSVSDSMGVLITVDGAINPGTLTIQYDLANLLNGWDPTQSAPWGGANTDYSGDNRNDQGEGDHYRVLDAGGVPNANSQKNKGHGKSPHGLDANWAFVSGHTAPWDDAQQAASRAAARCLETFDIWNSAPSPDNTALIQTAQQMFGMSLDGTTLTVPITIDVSQIADGFSSTEVQSVDLLGVKLQVTVVSALATSLPIDATIPDLLALDPSSIVDSAGNLVTDSSAVIANNGSSLIANNGGALIANNGSSLISNNGGGLTGSVRVPFQASDAKYGLLDFQELNWPQGAQVRVEDQYGNALTDWTTVDNQGFYHMTSVPSIAGVTFVHCKAGSYDLRTLAPQPAVNKNFEADVDSATTGVTSLVCDQITSGGYAVRDVDPRQGFLNAVSSLHQLMDYSQAEAAVSGSETQAAQLTSQLLTSNNVQTNVLNQPQLQSVDVTFDTYPTGAEPGLALVTGIPESQIAPGKTVSLPTQDFTFSNYTLGVTAKGYGGSSNPWFTNPATQTTSQTTTASGTATTTGGGTGGGGTKTTTTTQASAYTTLMASTTTTGTKGTAPALPSGPVVLTYDVKVKHGGGETVDYKFALTVSNFTLLDMGGSALPLKADLQVPPMSGQMMGNFWTFESSS